MSLFVTPSRPPRLSGSLLLLLAACTDAPKESDPDAPVDPCPVAVADPEALEFADLVLGEPRSATVTVLNNCSGSTALAVEVESDNSAFTVASGLLSVAPGELGTLAVSATVSDYTAVTGTLSLVTNDPANPLLTITLSASAAADQDGDGSTHDLDCDDGDAAIFPGATEVWYDGVDQDCAGDDDYDQDADGQSAAEHGGTDCADTDSAVYGGAVETWYDGVDQDCAGDDDFDQDADGQPASAHGGSDCADTDSAVYSGAVETWYDGIDQDCAGDDDFDQDVDGQLAVAYGGTDCVDTDSNIYAGAADTWYDGVDSDCAGNDDFDQDLDGYAEGVDDCDDLDGAISPAAAEIWYDGVDQDCAGDDDYDQDGDADRDLLYGGGDCQDLDATIHSGAAELWYDGIDQDCAGDDDYDQDADGQQAVASGGEDCDDTNPATYSGASDSWYDGVDSDCAGDDDYDQDADGYAENLDDCDDTDSTVFPGAVETWYDGVDQDCAGDDDYDQDGDGEQAFSAGGLDCLDTDASTLDGIDELPNGVDDNCDGSIDEGLISAGMILISEVMVTPSAVGETAGEWFEVYNPGSYTIDMNGWVIYSDDGGYLEITGSLPVPAGGYAVLGVNASSAANGGVEVDYTYARSSFGLATTDSIYLVAGAVDVASVAWGLGWPVSTGASLSLDLLGSDPTDADSWCVSTSTYGSGDRGTPGSANDLCPNIDHDGDGESEDDGDCDDTQASVSTSGTEIVDDDADNDCDGVFDELELAFDDSVHFDGSSFQTIFYTAGDFDGDGGMEALYYDGYAVGTVFDGADWRSWDGATAAFADGTITLPGYDLPVAHLGDQTGDGATDLLTLTGAGYGYAVWRLYTGDLAGQGASDAVVSGELSSASKSSGSGRGDTNGDGVDELFIGDYDADVSVSAAGQLLVYDLVGVTGSLTAADADWRLLGSSSNMELGEEFGTGDIDGDGYDDIVLRATSGSYHDLFVVPSDGMATPTTESWSTAYTLRISDIGTSGDDIVLGDYDGDGTTDIFGVANAVYTDLGGVTGTLTRSDAETDFSGEGATWMRADLVDAADFDADGADDLPVSVALYDEPYMGFLSLASLGATSSQADAHYAIQQEGSTSYYTPQPVRVIDLDGDGADEILFNTYDSSVRWVTLIVGQ